MRIRRRTFTFFGCIRGRIVSLRGRIRRRKDQLMVWLARRLLRMLERRGYRYDPDPVEPPQVVFNFLDPEVEEPKPFRRRSKATFVVGMLLEEEPPEQPKKIQKILYPLLVRSLSNVVVSVHPPSRQQSWQAWFVTPEMGVYNTKSHEEQAFLNAVYEHLEPIITSTLVIDNRFLPDLPQHLWQGNKRTKALIEAGRRLDSLGLLPAPFPLEEILTPEDLRHLKRLYGIGGLSYGNLSIREPGYGFWMSASGVDKGKLGKVGQDILLITGYDEQTREILVSVRPDLKPKRASVDAIEHHLIYHEFPEVQAIVHFHGWVEGVPVTHWNYPCGTLELAQEVVRLIRESPDPGRAIIGLRNHGVNITGPSLEDIFRRIEGKVSKYVPMS